MHDTLAETARGSTAESAREPDDIDTLRIDLAAAFRLAVHFDWHESVGNHFSAAVDADGARFLLNPKWRHFSEIRASDLLLLDADDESVMQGDDAPDCTAWCIHGSVHRALPRAKVLLHCHPPYATAVASLADPSIPPIDQNTARFFRRVAIDTHYGGLADDAEEGRRIAAAFGEHEIMMMGNHGVSVAAPTVALAFEHLYFLERACRTLVLARSTGQALSVMSDNLAEHTARGWEAYSESGTAHFEALKRMLDREQPDYRD